MMRTPDLQSGHTVERHAHRNRSAFVSFGLPIGDILSFKRDIPAITARISRDLFLADLESHEARINGPTPEDFDASLYAPAIWRSPHHVAAE